MIKRTIVPAGTKWGDIVGYSRAVRIGNLIEVAGTASVDEEGNIVAPGNAYEQTRFILQKMERALQSLGGSRNDVIRTRIFVKDISRWEEIGRAHGEFFAPVKPVTTMVEISRFIDPEMVVEIEATAILP